MIPISGLSIAARMVLTEWSLLLCLLSLWLLVYDRGIKGTLLALLPGAPLTLASYFLFQLYAKIVHVNLGYSSPGLSYRFFSALPAAPVAAGQALLTVCSLAALFRSVRWAHTHITLMSVKEAVDCLDTGLCYYWPGGVVKLANPKMEELCLALTGSPVRNGEVLWEAVRQNPIPVLSDGSVWSFHRAKLFLEGDPIYELTASDVTEEYHLIRVLREKESELADYQSRLHAYGDAVDEVTVQEETLAMKMNIHDELGRTLLISRRALENSDPSLSQQEITRLWRDAIRMGQRAGAAPSAEGTLRDITDAGRAIGISVRVDGALPEDTRTMGLLTAGARTALTNAYRHGCATELYIRIRQAEGRCEITYTNNGIPPAAPAAEGGGLSSLRRSTESLGGRMTVLWEPEFTLQLTLGERNRTT